MNFKTSLFIFGIFLTIVSCSRVPKTGQADFKSQNDSVSYALGFIEAQSVEKKLAEFPFDSLSRKDLGKVMARTAIKKQYYDFRNNQFQGFNEDMFYKGFLNQFVYGKSYFSEMSADMFLRKVFGQMKEKKDSIKSELAKTNLKAGADFLAKNILRQEVDSTESGLQYEILEKGTGEVPTLRDRIKCVYHGTLLDGTVFDSSLERKDTASFTVRGVIKGWTEALQMMPTGSKYRLYVPSKLAYGENGSGQKIGPNETLIFDLDLIDIIKKK